MMGGGLTILEEEGSFILVLWAMDFMVKSFEAYCTL
jgi:hypothetical protein